MQRLDQILLDRAIVDSRSKAEAFLKTTGVIISGQRVHKPGKKFPPDVEIQLIEEPSQWVSRAAHKLIAALDFWNIEVEDLRCLDIGTSTGGFSQVLVDRNAAHVLAVDTGTNQLHPSLHNEPRILSLEQTDFRKLEAGDFQQFDFACCDVSFISQKPILQHLPPFLKPGATIVTLYKPQFEVGREFVGKKGIVKDQARVTLIAEEIVNFAQSLGFIHKGQIDSPIKGGDGNQEYLMLWKWKQ